MSLRDDLNQSAPRLRRYARALVSGRPGPSALADEFVGAALRRALDCGIPGPRDDAALYLYSLVTDIHRESLRSASLGARAIESAPSYPGGARTMGKVQSVCAPQDLPSSALAALRLDEKEALLLVALEGLSHAHAARVLKISRPILRARLARAREALSAALCADAPQTAKTRPSHLRLVK
ncbi:sigma factor-like helix-turn-helix DNA-binding protein [Methylocapsa acidiphila]|uniref:sigma factor-like helix-turn-helix DNA-binding protein n=1 Tax=Methylocapsa acidiphila TaxID=133552 RepID=UPI000405C7A0|nr:sigma factor-like helix-turn-helix DNA-binding protein [Methylocapsa acidiphila]